jgi:hypothetical protein
MYAYAPQIRSALEADDYAFAAAQPRYLVTLSVQTRMFMSVKVVIWRAHLLTSPSLIYMDV